MPAFCCCCPYMLILKGFVLGLWPHLFSILTPYWSLFFSLIKATKEIVRLYERSHCYLKLRKYSIFLKLAMERRKMLDVSSSAFRVLKGARILNAQLSLHVKGNRKGTKAAHVFLAQILRLWRLWVARCKRKRHRGYFLYSSMRAKQENWGSLEESASKWFKGRMHYARI